MKKITLLVALLLISVFGFSQKYSELNNFRAWNISVEGGINPFVSLSENIVNITHNPTYNAAIGFNYEFNHSDNWSFILGGNIGYVGLWSINYTQLDTPTRNFEEYDVHLRVPMLVSFKQKISSNSYFVAKAGCELSLLTNKNTTSLNGNIINIDANHYTNSGSKSMISVGMIFNCKAFLLGTDIVYSQNLGFLTEGSVAIPFDSYRFTDRGSFIGLRLSFTPKK